MRNLKKILALALALVMSMSLMATANAFTDDDSITDTYETAVTVLSGLKVFQGYDDGTFQPQGAITRAEVAAIIYRIVTGDVADTQVGIYADYNKFDDVASTSWYAGYVNFCANAEYIKGYDARTFGPNDPVTGYQALAMILRALGYDKNGEFTGTNWTIQTAAVGESRGITKNITAGTLGVAATREVVAEILFQAILVNKVNYTPAFGYTEDDTSLGWDTFELEDITGVVVANEYADLYDTEALDEGETRLNVDGEDYTIAYATTVEDLGEARHAYVTGETVLAISDAGNTVWENAGAETDIAKDSDFEDVTSLERGDAEDFINFADVSADTYEADIRIVYSLTGDADDAVSIKAGAKLTGKQYSDIKDIFTDDDLADGWVVVGTKYDPDTAAGDDISNDITFRNFVKEYLVSGSKDVIEVDGADNGEWLKVIDNDGDGEADYVFRVDFAMSVIERISKDEEYTLADLDSDDAVLFGNMVKVAASDIVTEDELAEGDVVIYTMIDGVYYVDLAEMVTETIDRKGINSKTETITCDGTDYVQSHIGYTSETAYMYDVTDAHTEETYDLYLDHFGYVRLFIESEYNVFMLLTDGWYEDDNRTETFQAYYWDVDAAEETQIDVADGGSEFIADDNWTGVWGDQETWGRLLGADVTYDLDADTWRHTYATNIAGYSETDDGYALKTVEDSTSRVTYDVQAFAVDGLKDRYLDATTGTDDIQTTTNTQYYLVIRSADNRTVSGWNVDDVITWTGYANAPDEAKLVDGNSVGYAVTHESNVGSYNVADVVVFETVAYADRDTFFVYETNNYANIEYVWGIGYGEDGEIVDDRIDVDGDNSKLAGEIEFYVIDKDGNVRTHIDSNYADYDIYAGYVDTGWDIEDVDYIQVSDTAAGRLVITDADIYEVVLDDGDYDVEIVDRDEIDPNNGVILFTDGDDNVEYAILVGDVISPYDYDLDHVPLAAVEELFFDIMLDASAPTGVDAILAELAKYDSADKITSEADRVDATNAIVAAMDYIDANTTTSAERGAISDAIDLVEAALEEYINGNELTAAKAEAISRLETDADGAGWSNEMLQAAKDAINAVTDTTKTAEDLRQIGIAAAKAVKEEQEAAEAEQDTVEAVDAVMDIVSSEHKQIMGSDGKVYTFVGDFSIDENTVTISYETVAEIFDKKYPSDEDNTTTVGTADLARFLGLLHDKGVTEIGFGEETYKWNASGSLVGSNWTENGENNNSTLVKAIGAAMLKAYDQWNNGDPLSLSVDLTLNGVEYAIAFAADKLA